MKTIKIIAAAGVAGGLLALGSPLHSQEGDLLFSDDFNTDTSASWNTVNGAPAGYDDWNVDFAWDYSEYGIPAAPSTEDGSTSGVRFMVNKEYGTGYGLMIVPDSQNFTGDYVMKVDVWANFNGGLNGEGIGPEDFPGGDGSTEFATFGVAATGEFAHHYTADSGAEGAWFAIDGDGGSGYDYRIYTHSLLQEPTDGVYAAGSHADDSEGRRNNVRRWSNPYYHTAVPGGMVVPDEQLRMYEENEWMEPGSLTDLGETQAGAPGYMWHRMVIEVRNGVVSWYMNDLLIATVTQENAVTEVVGEDRINGGFSTDGNIFIGCFDSYNSISSYNSQFTFSLFDNVRVYTLPPVASGYASWATDNIVDENARGPTDNPSGDGIENILKYALNLDPTVANVQALPQGVLEDDGGQDYLTLTVTRNPDATDVNLEVEVSADLATWNSGAGHTVVLLDDGTTLKVRDDTPIGSAGKRALRLKATMAE